MSAAELATSYAALILADEGLDCTPEKLQLLLNASRNDVESIWTVLFCKALEGKNVKEMLLNVGSGGSAAPVASGGAGAVPSGGVGGTAEDKAEEKKEEEAEESDEDMGFGLFD